MPRAVRVKAKPRAFQKSIMDAAATIQENMKLTKLGKPSLYHETFPHLVEVLTLVGGILNDVADLLGVREDTVSGWMTQHPAFSMAIKTARKRADAEVVKSLRHRAIGYSHSAVKIFNDEGRAMVVPYTEQYAPDPTAAIFWLCNRDPDNWRRGDPDAGANVTAEEMKRALRAELQELDDANLTPEETAKLK